MTNNITTGADSKPFDLFLNGPPSPATYTTRYLIDRQQIVDVVNALCLYAELGEWHVVERLFDDSVKLDYSSMEKALSGGDGSGAMLKTSAEVISMWKGSIPGFDFLQHLMTHHLVHVEGAAASCICQVHATHFIGKDDWTVVGRYEFGLANKAGAWRVNAMTLHSFRQLGIESVRARAAEAMERRVKESR